MREAVIHIPHAEFEKVGLGDLVSLFRDAGLRDVTELACEGDGGLVVFTVDTPIDEEDLATTDHLEWWERLSGDSDGVDYLCKIVMPEVAEGTHLGHNPGISSNEIRVEDDGVDVAIVGEQEDIAREIGDYGAAGMNVLLHRISDYAGPRNTLDALTDRQREILKTAYDLGYFDVPRSVSTATIADELQLDSSTVAEHLQRAERNLVSSLLAPP